MTAGIPVLDPAVIEMTGLSALILCGFCRIPMSEYDGHWCATEDGEVWRRHGWRGPWLPEVTR